MRPLTLGDERCMFRRVQVQRHREYSRRTLFDPRVGMPRLVVDTRNLRTTHAKHGLIQMTDPQLICDAYGFFGITSHRPPAKLRVVGSGSFDP